MIDEQNNNNPAEENLFEKMENAPPHFPIKRLERSKTNVMLTGVCAGIANYLNADVANIRLIALLSLLLGGWSAVAYLLIAALLPSELNPQKLTDEEAEVLHKENFKILAGGVLILIGFYFALQKIGFGGERIFVFPNTFVMPIFALVFGIYLLFTKREIIREEGAENIIPKFQKSRNHKMLTGVCGGLAEYFDVDPGSVRIIFIILTMLTMGLFAVAYVIIGVKTNMEEPVSNEI